MAKYGKIGSQNLIRIYGKDYVQYRDERGRIMRNIPLKQVQSSIETRERVGNIAGGRPKVRQEQDTKTHDNKHLHKLYNGLRMAQATNLYSIGGFIGGDTGLTMSVVHKSAQVLKQSVDFVADVYGASTGETMRVSNFKNVLSRAINPMQLVGDQIGFAIDNMRIKRENHSLEYYRQLTGNIINYKDKGKY